MQVEIVLDSKNPYTGKRLTTFYLVYPQTIHNHVLTHRVFSRNASSFRAVSSGRVLAQETVYPVWSKEKRGMQGEKFDALNPGEGRIISKLDRIVDEMESFVSKKCQELLDLGAHHQNVNDYLRPFRNIHVVLTGTEFRNFFNVRLHSKVKPEMEMLARHMKVALDTSTPQERYVHLPFIDPTEYDTLPLWDACLTSIARCARISYLHKGSSDDIELGETMWKRMEYSPFEHVAFARESGVYANFQDWQSYRNQKGQ